MCGTRVLQQIRPRAEEPCTPSSAGGPLPSFQPRRHAMRMGQPRRRTIPRMRESLLGVPSAACPCDRFGRLDLPDPGQNLDWAVISLWMNRFVTDTGSGSNFSKVRSSGPPSDCSIAGSQLGPSGDQPAKTRLIRGPRSSPAATRGANTRPSGIPGILNDRLAYLASFSSGGAAWLLRAMANSMARINSAPSKVPFTR